MSERRCILWVRTAKPTMLMQPVHKFAMLAALGVGVFLAPPALRGQGQAAPRPAPSIRELAPIDITGYWVSVVTEDWRYRMVMPQTGDFGSVPLNSDGRKKAETW